MFGELDPLHLFLGQCVAASYVSSAVVTFRQVWTNSPDWKVQSGWLLSRVVGFTFMLMACIDSIFSLAKEKQRYNEQYMSFPILAYILVICGSLGKLWQHFSSESETGKSNIPSKGVSGGVVNRHLLFNVMIMLPVVATYVMAPQLMVDNFISLNCTKLHAHILRKTALVGLIMLFQTITAFQYDREDDKRTFFYGHIVVLAMQLFLKVFYQYEHSLTVTSHFYPTFVLVCLMLGNAIWGAFFIRNKEKKL